MTLIELAKSGGYISIESTSWTAAELNARDEDGLTALMHAAVRGDYRTIDALKNAGADLEIKDKDGKKAVHHAAKYGHGTAILYLIEGGCGG